jgi:hypothetical protein
VVTLSTMRAIVLDSVPRVPGIDERAECRQDDRAAQLNEGSNVPVSRATPAPASETMLSP